MGSNLDDYLWNFFTSILFSIIVFTNSVGGGSGSNAQHDVASEILSIGPIQLDDLSQTDLVTPITISASSSGAGQQNLVTPISTGSG